MTFLWGAVRSPLTREVMAARCPACQSEIPLGLDDTPRTQVSYRCPICHLELVFDSRTNLLIVAPLPGEPDQENPPKKKRYF